MPVQNLLHRIYKAEIFFNIAHSWHMENSNSAKERHFQYGDIFLGALELPPNLNGILYLIS